MQDFTHVRLLIAHALPPQPEQHLKQCQRTLIEQACIDHFADPTFFRDKSIALHGAVTCFLTRRDPQEQAQAKVRLVLVQIELTSPDIELTSYVEGLKCVSTC